ncbi:hypothetical protein [Streptosporangium amethystogenes]|uniref:hypothetical protein n=1 Tax=Streptosporangium amethystogenes TaxID=2002 RepID=UPI0004C68EE5|nr:hypothetical protein [Streptosporangium amethystogenes]
MSTRADEEAARVAQQVQEQAPTWFVMWSLRHRRFEAWECSDPARCRTTHGRTASELWDRMQQIDLELQQTPAEDAPPDPPPGPSPDPPPPAQDERTRP